jgi:hypothetical protein
LDKSTTKEEILVHTILTKKIDPDRGPSGGEWEIQKQETSFQAEDRIPCPSLHLPPRLQGTNATINTFTINLSSCPLETKGTFSFETGPKSGGPPEGSGVTIKKISSSASGTPPLFSTLHLKLSPSAANGSEMIAAEGLPNERFIIGE